MNKQERAERQVEDWVKHAEAYFATEGIPPAELTSEGTLEHIAQTYGRDRVLHTLRRMAGSPSDTEIVWVWGSWTIWAIAEESGIQVPPPAGTPDPAVWQKGHNLLQHDPDFAQRVRTTAQEPDNPVRRFLLACSCWRAGIACVMRRTSGMSERKRTLEQAKAMEEVRMGMGMAQLREAIAEEMPWLSADEVNEVVDKELITAARVMDENEAQQGDSLSAQSSAWVRSASP